MKGFDALVLALVPEMVRAPLKRPVHIALSYDEEIACRGAPSMVRAMSDSIPIPSAVIVGEPTRHAVVTGHKASVQLRTQVTGYAVHSSRIDQGVSAVMNAARLITWHEDVMDDNRRRMEPANPFEPMGTQAVQTVEDLVGGKPAPEGKVVYMRPCMITPQTVPAKGEFPEWDNCPFFSGDVAAAATAEGQ